MNNRLFQWNSFQKSTMKTLRIWVFSYIKKMEHISENFVWLSP